MNKIIIYLIAILLTIGTLFVLSQVLILPYWLNQILVAIDSALVATMGGVLYCLRGVYLNKSVHKNWDPDWEVWYYLRPLTSLLAGIASFIFLKAGLLILDAEAGDSSYGYWVVAFVAGYNVDNFLKKIEDIAKSVWGIEKSRSGQDKD